MKRFLMLILFLALFSTAAFPDQAKAFQEFTGKVVEYVESFKSYMIVEGLDGRRITFRVGIRTRYYPVHEWPKPIRGDWVKVEYRVNRGVYVGYRVTRLPGPPGPPSPDSTHTVHQPREKMTGDLTVIEDSVNLRSGPGTEYSIVGKAKSGQYLVLKGKTGKWYKVLEPEKRLDAWVYAPLVRVDRMERYR